MKKKEEITDKEIETLNLIILFNRLNIIKNEAQAIEEEVKSIQDRIDKYYSKKYSRKVKQTNEN